MREGKARGSELVIYEDGTLYHIDLRRADNIPRNIFLVGAAQRVDIVAKHFDSITFRHKNLARPEFSLASGRWRGIPMAVLSIGIGVDNMEIALNELHALFEYDHKKDKWSRPQRINIIRIGTSGTSLPEIPAGAIAISRYAIGLDNLGAYYPAIHRNTSTQAIERKFKKTSLGKINILSYSSAASPKAVAALQKSAVKFEEKYPMLVSGITTASPGFFAPEGRTIGRIKTALNLERFLQSVKNFKSGQERIVNHEMETSILFRIGHEILGYNAGAVCLVVDNLSTNEFLEKKIADTRMQTTIKIALEAMRSLHVNS